ncbi:MAG: IS1634 family transposase [Euryarchaeota archaeon]|nr:IS1634 family transposase [Euryarchaeota archaeon]
MSFIGDKIQSILKTPNNIKQNKNKTFPIGSIQTVKHLFEELHLSPLLNDLKHCGHQLSGLVTGLVSYKLTEDLSVSRCHQWMTSNPLFLEYLQLSFFEDDTLYRGLGIIGENRHLILRHLLHVLKNEHGVGLDMVFMDWTSVYFEAKPTDIIKYGYSRDHRPDRPQITIGLAQDQRSQLPVGLSIQPGNINDQTHFKITYNQIKPGLRKGSVLIFDAGATGIPNLDLLVSDKMKYLSRMKLNTSDIKQHLDTFHKDEWTPVVTGNQDEQVYGKKLLFPSRTKYLYFSKNLCDDTLLNRRKHLEQEYDEALDLWKTIQAKKQPRQKYRNSNHFLQTHLSYTFPLTGLSREEAIEQALQFSITGKEGFFALISNKDFSLHEALQFYREKDSIEKLFNSIKNEIHIRPTRCWTQEAIYGSILIVFLAQLVISMLRYKHASLRHVSTKFIMQSLSNFALTIILGKNGMKNRVYSNFDWINTLIFCGKTPGS